jgi:hypothetical protein
MEANDKAGANASLLFRRTAAILMVSIKISNEKSLILFPGGCRKVAWDELTTSNARTAIITPVLQAGWMKEFIARFKR